MADLSKSLTPSELSDLKAKAKAENESVATLRASGSYRIEEVYKTTVRARRAFHIAANPETILRLIAMVEWRDAWQPIETAPKDQTPVFVAVPWPRAPTGWLTGEARFEPEMRDGSWWWANMSENDFDGPGEPIIPAPTHWQPLPVPPSEALAATEPPNDKR